MGHRTSMWETYRYLDHEVTIIQQWQDPFGKPMIRVAAKLHGEIAAAGLPEADFLSKAQFVGKQEENIVEGAN